MSAWAHCVARQAEWQRRRYLDLIDAHPDQPSDVLAQIAAQEAQERALAELIDLLAPSR